MNTYTVTMNDGDEYFQVAGANEADAMAVANRIARYWARNHYAVSAN